MKTLNEIEDDITFLKQQMLQKEISNDLYYSSPEYHKSLIRLEALEHEANVLKGKFSPHTVGFDHLNTSQKIFLQHLAEQNGDWFAETYANFDEDDLKSALRESKENDMFIK